MQSETDRNTVVKCLEDSKLSVIIKPRPEISDGEILVRMNACGICGTDVAKVYDPYFKKPQQIGHELVATVVESKSDKFKIGERVAIAHHAPDPNSHYTMRGSAPMDPVFKSSNIDPGGFANLIRVPKELVQQTVVAIPEQVPDLRAVFMEPLACCLRALDRVSLQNGDTALIIGAGAVGILFLPLLNDAGVKSIVLDMRTERLELAKQWGAVDGCVVGNGNIAEVAKRHSKGRGVDLVILSVVNKATLYSAQQSIRDGGTILLFGSKPANNFAIDWWEIWRREINLITSYSATPELMPRAMALLAKPNYAFETLVSHSFTLSQAQQAFDLAHEGKASKIVLTNMPLG
jgi:L-iditol 2-dehydrogenase